MTPTHIKEAFAKKFTSKFVGSNLRNTEIWSLFDEMKTIYPQETGRALWKLIHGTGQGTYYIKVDDKQKVIDTLTN